MDPMRGEAHVGSGSEEQGLASSRGGPDGLPKRWSAQRKAEVVFRLWRGEDIG